MSRPVKTSSFVSPVWIRTDLPREEVLRYWAGPHGRIVGRLPGMAEYIQRHFSPSDHGYWPASHKVGTIIPPELALRRHGGSPLRQHGPRACHAGPHRT